MLSLPPGPTNGTLENISTILSQPIMSSLIQPLLVALGMEETYSFIIIIIIIFISY